jgi:hypothetical protein
MGGLFNSLGLALAFAGIGILLAGLFLTPMREVVLNKLPWRREEEVMLPPMPVPSMPAPPVPLPQFVPAQPGGEAAAAARDQEALFARALVTAQRTAEELVRRAKTEAQDIIDKAQVAANDIVSTGRRNASEVLRKAEQEAEMIITAANENAAARLALLQAEVERLVVDANQVFQGAQQSVQQNVASLKARLELVASEPDRRPHDGHDPSASGSPPASRDGMGTAWVMPPSVDSRAAVGAGVDGAGGSDRSRSF